jgi:hypothetical protein
MKSFALLGLPSLRTRGESRGDVEGKYGINAKFGTLAKKQTPLDPIFQFSLLRVSAQTAAQRP